MRTVELNVLDDRWPLDYARLEQAVQQVLEAAAVDAAEVSLAIVDNAMIWELNRRHLAHDYPTDVLSFRLDEDEGPLEGELIVSAEMAAAKAPEYGWSAADELLLYVIHGALHLVGYDDHSEADREMMRAAEARHLAALGVRVPHATTARGEEGAGSDES